MLGFHAISAAPISALPAVSAGGAIAGGFDGTDSDSYRVFAATREFITRADDEPPDQPFLGTLVRPLRFTRSITGENGYGELSVGYGEIELINAERDYDDLVENFGVDGRDVVLRAGAKSGGIVAPYADFVDVAQLTGTSWHANDRTLRISVRDKSYRMETPTQPNIYAGEGGLLEGPADLAGKRKPMALGELDGLTPVLVVPSELIYQFHDGSAESAVAVYDSGDALAATSDHDTLAELSNATIAAGEYGTCLVLGIFRLGGAPSGKITCDVKGENAGGYIETTADIVRFLVENAGAAVDADFDDATFSALNAVQDATIGYYLSEQSNETLAETVARLMGGIGGWAGFTRLGMFEVRRFDAPGIAPVERYDQYDFVVFNKEPLPAGIDPVVRRFRVTYANNWTLLSNSDLAGTVIENEPERAALLGAPHQIAATSAADATRIAALHPMSHDPDPVQAFFANEADAQAEADRLLALYGTARAAYRFSVKGRLFCQEVGQTVYVEYPLYGLDGGVMLRAVEVEDNVEDNESQVLVFG